jgi:hypothetical protein
MPLQIRRGTTSQRLSITPLVSELVYDTTTKLVYVGDGVTAGGIAIDQDSSPDFPLGDLSDIDLNNLAEGDILIYDGTDWVNSELSFSSLVGVNLNSPEVNQVLKFNGTSWSNENEDSSLLVTALEDLTNVEINNPEVNQVLKFNGTSWSNENEDSSLLVTALEDLTNVEITSLATDQVLKYDGTNWINDNNSIVSLGDVEIIDAVVNQFLKYDGANWVNSNTFDGDVTGSVFSDNSTLLVDGTNGEIVGNVNNLLITTEQVNISIEGFDRTPLSITTSTDGGNACNVNFFASRTSVANPTILAAGDSIIDLNSSGWDGVNYLPTAAIKLGVDKYTTAIGTGIVPGRIVFLTFNESGTTGISNAMIFNRFGNLGIGKDDPAQKLDVQGNGVFAGFVQFGSLDTTARNALSAANGMVIYNTTDNRFQGYQNGAWINLDDGTAA